MPQATMPDRFLAVMHQNRGEWPAWIEDLRPASEQEQKLGAHVVAEIGCSDMHIHITDVHGGIDRFNMLYPRNGTLVLLLFPDFSDGRIVDKSVEFLKREYARYRWRYQ